MNAETNKCSVINPNLVLSVTNNGTIIYSNEAGEPFLKEWGVKGGEKLPAKIREVIKRVISFNNPEKTEVKIWNKTYLLVFHPVLSEECVNISGFDISNQKKLEENASWSEKHYRLLFERMTEGFCLLEVIYNNDGRPCEYRYLEANPAFELHTGKKKEQIIGKTVREIFPEVSTIEIEEFGKVALSSHSTHFVRYIPNVDKFFEINTFSFEKGKFAVIFTDITELKRAEMELKKTQETLEEKIMERTEELEKAYTLLKESEQSLAEAQEIVHIGNWSDDLRTDKILWSDEVYRIFGFKPQEFVASYTELLNRIHPEDRVIVLNAGKQALEQGFFDAEYRIIRAGGVERIVNEVIRVVYDEENKPILVKGTVQDITERIWAEKKLIESEMNVSRFFDSNMFGVIYFNLDGSITKANDKFLEIVDYTREDLLAGLVRWDKMDPQEHLLLNKQYFKKLITTGRVESYEKEYIRKDGSRVPILLGIATFDRAHGGYAFVFDITERKRSEEKLRESEEKYRNIVETANEGIAVIDREGMVTYANKKMLDMFGYTLEEGLGKSVWGFLSEESKTIVELSISRWMQGVNETYELQLTCKDGSPIWVLCNDKPFFNENGKYIGAMCMFTDITKRKEAEAALEKIEIARKQEIHHRIKNNLQVISSLLDLQAEKIKHKKNITKSEVLKAFRESQSRVLSMALIHEELHRGGNSYTLNFSSYIEELAENLFLTYQLGNETTRFKKDIEEDIFFNMDVSVPLGIITNELISNALKYAFVDRDSGEIKIKLHREEDREWKLRGNKRTTFTLSVSDDGAGLPENICLDNLDSLGLQLVTTLIDQLDGELKLEEKMGQSL